MNETVTQPATEPQRNRRKAIVIGVAAALVVAVGAWLVIRHSAQKQLSPEETLVQLQESSDPVASTDQERVEWLNENSGTVMAEEDQTAQLNILNALRP